MEFYPYKKMFEEGLASVMVAHLNVPSLEPNQIILLLFQCCHKCASKGIGLRVLFYRCFKYESGK
jgi:hypothetical protein